MLSGMSICIFLLAPYEEHIFYIWFDLPILQQASLPGDLQFRNKASTESISLSRVTRNETNSIEGLKYKHLDSCTVQTAYCELDLVQLYFTVVYNSTVQIFNTPIFMLYSMYFKEATLVCI